MSDEEERALDQEEDVSDEGDDYEPDDTPISPGAELPEGVQKEILTKGDGWKKPKKGDDVQVHYVGTLQADGSQFDSSRDRGKHFTFSLGNGSVIKGWDVGVATMLKGEVAKFTLAPNYAYGASGSPPKIPEDATLVFEVELVGWTSKDDLFGDDGCIKALVQEGTSTWKHPKADGEVLMSLKATAEGGDVIEERTSVDYVLGSGALGPLGMVVDKALVGMAKNEKCSLAIAKDYVYKGSAHGAVAVDLELLEIYSVSDVSFKKDSSIMKKTIKEGDGYEKPQDQYTVTLRLEAVVDDVGKPLPGSQAPVVLSFEACNGEVCDVIEHAVADMKKGERAVVTCTGAAVPKVADGRLGLADVKASKVVLTMELLDMTKCKDVWSMANEEKVELAQKRKEQGGKLFSGKRFELALEKYKKVGDAITNLDSFAEDLKEKATELKKVAELNKAAVFLKLLDFEGVIASCDKVLKDDRNNVKALFRRAKARHERNDHEDAKSDLTAVLNLDAGNQEAKVLLQHVNRAQKLVDKAAKATYAKMCAGLGKLGPRKEEAAPTPKDFDDGEDSEREEEEREEARKAAAKKVEEPRRHSRPRVSLEPPKTVIADLGALPPPRTVIADLGALEPPRAIVADLGYDGTTQIEHKFGGNGTLDERRGSASQEPKPTLEMPKTVIADLGALKPPRTVIADLGALAPPKTVIADLGSLSAPREIVADLGV